MHSHVDNIQEHQNRSTVNEAPIKQGENDSTFEDNSPQAKEAAQLQAMADSSPDAEEGAQLQAIANTSPDAKEAVQLQAMADEHGAKEQLPNQNKKNNTGLPDDLKTGIENLSGLSMDDVKVHYNSSKPAELQAHAYAEGTDIYIGPGQVEHLPHEAWHVVQQKQGRVKPTLQMEGGVEVNDDKGLEKEADVMGAKALISNKENRNNLILQSKIKKGIEVSQRKEINTGVDFKKNHIVPSDDLTPSKAGQKVFLRYDYHVNSIVGEDDIDDSKLTVEKEKKDGYLYKFQAKSDDIIFYTAKKEKNPSPDSTIEITKGTSPIFRGYDENKITHFDKNSSTTSHSCIPYASYNNKANNSKKKGLILFDEKLSENKDIETELNKALKLKLSEVNISVIDRLKDSIDTLSDIKIDDDLIGFDENYFDHSKIKKSFNETKDKYLKELKECIYNIFDRKYNFYSHRLGHLTLTEIGRAKKVVESNKGKINTFFTSFDSDETKIEEGTLDQTSTDSNETEIEEGTLDQTSTDSNETEIEEKTLDQIFIDIRNYDYIENHEFDTDIKDISSYYNKHETLDDKYKNNKKDIKKRLKKTEDTLKRLKSIYKEINTCIESMSTD